MVCLKGGTWVNKRRNKLVHLYQKITASNKTKLQQLFEENEICYYSNNEAGKRLFEVKYQTEAGEFSFFPHYIFKTEDVINVYDVVEDAEIQNTNLSEKAIGLLNFKKQKEDEGVAVNVAVVYFNQNGWYKYIPSLKKWVEFSLFN